MALPTRHIERPHADGAYVAERLRLDGVVEARPAMGSVYNGAGRSEIRRAAGPLRAALTR
jgi:hypothetical protein